MQNKPMMVGRDFEMRVLALLNRKRQHVLIGEVSLETGFSLSTVEYHLEQLESRGAIRRLSHLEKKKVMLHDLCEAFVLVDSSLFTLIE